MVHNGTSVLNDIRASQNSDFWDTIETQRVTTSEDVVQGCASTHSPVDITAH